LAGRLGFLEPEHAIAVDLASERALLVGKRQRFEPVLFPYLVDVAVQVVRILFAIAESAMGGRDDAIRRMNQAAELGGFHAAEVGEDLVARQARHFPDFLIIAIRALQGKRCVAAGIRRNAAMQCRTHSAGIDKLDSPKAL
jgi:hypothetical protein